MSTVRINLWSCPRNLSTALMYSFAQRPNCTVVDEPLYAHYLAFSGIDHPGRAEVLSEMEQDGEKVVAELMRLQSTSEVFFKHMTHHLGKIKEDFISQCKNVIFIRDPREIIASYAKINPEPTLREIGVKMQLEFHQRLTDRGIPHVIMDATDLRKDPEQTLRKLCQALDISFEPAMLTWEAGPRPEDGCWAKHWYDNLHTSTGFQPYVKKEVILTPFQEEVAREAEKAYLPLHEKRLR